MKKLIALVLFVINVIFTFTSCGKRSENSMPTLEYLYNTSESHQAVGEYIQSALAAAGIRVTLSNQEWGAFLSTRKSGDYTLARNGWLADFSDPVSFLDMWVSSSGNNDIGFGKGWHKDVSIYSLDLRDEGYDVFVEGGTWSETYDRLIAIIKTCTDVNKRFRLMHLAEDMIMDTGCIMPLYFYTDLYMKDKSLEGFYSSPLGIKFFSGTSYGGKQSISVSLASEPQSLDPALSSTVDSNTMLSHLFSGLTKWSVDKTGNAVIVPDAAEALPLGVQNADGSVTYVFTLRENMTWSDGKRVTAHDFEFAWKRAASPALGADYGYMFEVIRGYGGKNEDLNVSALDERTLSVTLEVDVPYFYELLAFPTFFPVREDVIKNESWAADSSTFISNGAYTMEAWNHNSLITLVKNKNHHSANTVTMPKINFFLSDDGNNMLANFKNRDWQFIDNLPTNEIKALKTEYGDEFFTVGQIGTYYISWNINKSILPRSSELSGNERALAEAEIRKAINMIPDRNYIAEEIGQAGQIPASSFVALGIKNPDGSEFSATAGGNNNYSGYFDVSRDAYRENVLGAVEVLKKYYDLDIP
ncbi:MAG: hypothetical protein E7673_00620 [Ruminococcaceae bacterium]|nr:hypothetical protein [Oscillospiraceae bacterium]